MLLRHRLSIVKHSISTKLRSSILPILPYPVILHHNIRRARRLYIPFSQIPLLNNATKFLHISKTRSIATILNNLHCLLIIGTPLQSLISELAAILGSKQISTMVCNRILNTAVSSEISCNSHIASIRILLLRFLGIDAHTIPSRTAPCIPGKRFLHTEAVIGPKCKFALTITGFKNELSHRH